MRSSYATGGSTATAVGLKRKSPGSSGAVTPAAPSNVLVRIVEKSILRSLAFVLYHLDRAQARYCARSILQWYQHLQKRLPLFAIGSLEQFATSFVALSDAEFTAFWLSLVDEPSAPPSPQYTAVSIEDEQADDAMDDPQERDATLVKRLYRQICCRIQRLFGLPTCIKPRNELWHAQTPLTSPDDKYDERRFYVRRASLSLAVATARHASANSSCDYDHEYAVLHVEGSSAAVTTEPSEPGWAVEYMEQESTVSSEMTLRMRRMMHSSIPLNLFRVTVVYPASGDGMHDDDGTEAAGFVGVVSPDSFPPTPITRDLQTRRIHHYTATVLDHATLALRLLDTNYAG